jgi:hypothetical protein
MAGIAIPGLRVGAAEVGSRLGVIEGIALQGYQAGLAALVLGMAEGAILALVAMVPRARGDALGDLLVAGEALDRRHLTGGGVARRAIGFAGLGGMGGAQGTGDLRDVRGLPDGGEDGGQDREGGESGGNELGFHSYQLHKSYNNGMKKSIREGRTRPDFLPGFTSRGD